MKRRHDFLNLNKSILKLKGKEKGPTSIVLVGVHGNEKCGIIALKNILINLKIKKGVVIFGYGNPKAIATRNRFIESNLNRMFKKDNLLSEKERESYEYVRAQFLKKYFKQGEVLLDIHASVTPNSKPFIICEANAKQTVKYLPINLVVSGFDNIEPGGTDYYMNSIGKIGICVECGYLDSSDSVQVAEKCILAFLATRGHIVGSTKIQKQSHIIMDSIYITKTNVFSLSKSFNDFENVVKGQVLGQDGGLKVQAEKDSIILFARNRNQVGEEAFLLGEKKKLF